MGCRTNADSRLKAREAATDRRADKRAAEMADRRAAMEERMAERKQKESATMDMFVGGGSLELITGCERWPRRGLGSVTLLV